MHFVGHFVEDMLLCVGDCELLLGLFSQAPVLGSPAAEPVRDGTLSEQQGLRKVSALVIARNLLQQA